MRNSSARAAVFNEAAHSQTFNKRRQATSSPAVAHAATPAATPESIRTHLSSRRLPARRFTRHLASNAPDKQYVPAQRIAVQTAPTPPTDPDGGVIDHGDGSFTVVRNNLIV